MPKVLILSNKVPYPSKDGSSIAMARLLENLLDIEDCSITYGALNTLKHRKSIDEFPKEIQNRIDLHSFKVNTSPTIFNGLHNLLLTKAPFNTIRFFVEPMKQWLEGYENESFDLTVIEGAFMGDYLSLAQEKSKKVVLRAHNLEHKIWERSFENTRSVLKKWYFKIQAKRLKIFETLLCKQVDAIWSISPVDSHWFEALNKHTSFIPVSIHAEDPNFSIAKNKCFFLGALDWHPNIESVEWFLKHVWPIITAANPEMEFHIAGNNTPKYLEQLQVRNVFVHGRVPNAKDFAEQHGISIIPLLSGSGVRIKLLENGSQGIPTVSTSVGAEGIYSKGSNIIPITDTPQEMAEVVLQLASDLDRTFSLAQAFHEDIKARFSPITSIQTIQQAWPI